MRYLLRTDVVYARPAAGPVKGGEGSPEETPEELKHQARLRGLARQLGGLGGQGLVEDAPSAKTAKKPVKKSKLKGKAKNQEAPAAKSKPKLKDRSYGGSAQAGTCSIRPLAKAKSRRRGLGRSKSACRGLAGVPKCGADSEKSARGTMIGQSPASMLTYACSRPRSRCSPLCP